jgi:hypothetical protein
MVSIKPGARHCLDPRTLDLIPTIDGIWLRVLQLTVH